MTPNQKHGATGTGSGEQDRRYLMIHCPTGEPGPPYEVLGVDHESLGTFQTLAAAKAFAEEEAARYGAEVLMSPLARGYM